MSSDSIVLDSTKLPCHVAIIMDGNGRWARKRLFNRIKGHEQGVETVRTIVRASRELNIPILTLYAFSTENWQRSKTEITGLMTLLKKFLRREVDELHEQGIRLNVIGQPQRLPTDVRAALEESLAYTAGNRNMQLNLALSYGGRTEIIEMVRSIAQQVAAGKLQPSHIDESLVTEHLYTAGQPDPDLLIRTSGEMRISNFLLWQLAYTELFVTQTLWPDFNRNEYYQILACYQQRNRRFGRIQE